MMLYIRTFILLLFLQLVSQHIHGADYYVHPIKGSDTNSGLTAAQAVRSLKKASSLSLRPGDRLLLAAGQRHAGSLELINLKGHINRPIIVETAAWLGEEAS